MTALSVGAVGVVALVAGALLGMWLVRRSTPPQPPPRNVHPGDAHMSAQVVAALRHGVAVLDPSERVLLSNAAAGSLGVLIGDRVAIPELLRHARLALQDGTPVRTQVDLPGGQGGHGGHGGHSGRGGREPLALSLTAVPLPGDDGRVAAVALLLDDVSEQRRLEAVRRDFVANVSHELKTPVGALTLLAEAVQDAADDPEAVQRFAGRMQHEGARLGRLVRELIELSRLQGAEPLPGDTMVDVGAVLDDAADRTRLVAEAAGISVFVRASDDLIVRGSEAQLATAVGNLVDNAISYSPSGTRVAVNGRRVTDASGEWAEISVSDQGIGIAESELGRIFERFYRVDPARSRATGGTGLGLAIVKHVVSNHGGTVTVWSVEGAGTTFTIRLPLVHSKGAPSRADELLKGSA